MEEQCNWDLESDHNKEVVAKVSTYDRFYCTRLCLTCLSSVDAACISSFLQLVRTPGTEPSPYLVSLPSGVVCAAFLD